MAKKIAKAQNKGQRGKHDRINEGCFLKYKHLTDDWPNKTNAEIAKFAGTSGPTIARVRRSANFAEYKRDSRDSHAGTMKVYPQTAPEGTQLKMEFQPSPIEILTDAVERLVEIATSHEKRLERMEQQQLPKGVLHGHNNHA